MSKPATRNDAIKELEETMPWISPRNCFIEFKNTREGWRPIPGTGCAHYVAHQLGGPIGLVLKCSADAKMECRVPDLVKDMKEIPADQVEKGDVWARTGRQPHAGIISSVGNGVIMVHHLSNKFQRACVHEVGKEYTEVINGITKTIDFRDGRFYRMEKRWLCNLNDSDPKRKPEFHDLTNEKKLCQISEIKRKVYAKTKDSAQKSGFDPCAYCMPGESKKS